MGIEPTYHRISLNSIFYSMAITQLVGFPKKLPNFKGFYKCLTFLLFFLSFTKCLKTLTSNMLMSFNNIGR